MDRNRVRQALLAFLKEDVGRGDLTSESVFHPDDEGKADLVARQSFLAAGATSVAAEVFMVQNPAIRTSKGTPDGTLVRPGETMLSVAGPVIDLLKAERVALNLLQRLCGIATLTRQFVEKAQGCEVRITDTRKTTPGLRMFEKFAVRIGGGYNHRFNLADGVLIKDNHIAACGSIREAVERVRQKIPHTIRIEVETDTIDQVEECLQCNVDIIMLDNMDIATMARAVKLINGRAM
ncbi:MAG: carboxylating nicotinate-nucleotide diphosphorylase, partial [Desulfopila sp.]|nr:carboxylating nicotinate-nucleotide diphosphorylase [Desulfopila sp.]